MASYQWHTCISLRQSVVVAGDDTIDRCERVFFRSINQVEDKAWYFYAYGNINHPIVISSRMEISILISTNYRPCLCSSFSNAKLFCIINAYWPLFSEGSSTQFKTKLALIGFILWHLWESEYQHSLSTVIKCQICGGQCAKSIVLA